MGKARGSKHYVTLGGERVWVGSATGEKEALDKFHSVLIEHGQYDTLEEFAGARGFTIDDFSTTKA